jgi:hypothetical protein
MRIECTYKRPDGLPVVTTISNVNYEFLPDERGRAIANVDLKEHVDCFLARQDIYRAVDPEEARPAARPAPKEIVSRDKTGDDPPVEKAAKPATPSPTVPIPADLKVMKRKELFALMKIADQKGYFTLTNDQMRVILAKEVAKPAIPE